MEFLLRALWASSSVPVGIWQLARIARIARPTRARCLKRARLQFRVFYMYCAREVRGLLTKLRGPLPPGARARKCIPTPSTQCIPFRV